MSFVHSKSTYISIGGFDISPFCNTSNLVRKGDKHDLTTYGKNSHVYDGGLKDGTAGAGGTYDNTAAGPAKVLKPLIGTVVPLIRRTEGTGSGKPQETVNVLVEEYQETNPVADYVQWSVTWQCSDDIVDSIQ